MNELLNHLIEALREELTQYGEMLARLEHQQELVIRRQAPDLLQSVVAVEAQAEVIRAARLEREARSARLAQTLGLDPATGFKELTAHLPADYRPLVQALVQENNELLVRVQQRARQNHLLLSRAMELMQRFINTLLPGAGPATYTGAGRSLSATLPQQALYEAVG